MTIGNGNGGNEVEKDDRLWVFDELEGDGRGALIGDEVGAGANVETPVEADFEVRFRKYSMVSTVGHLSQNLRSRCVRVKSSIPRLIKRFRCSSAVLPA